MPCGASATDRAVASPRTRCKYRACVKIRKGSGTCPPVKHGHATSAPHNQKRGKISMKQNLITARDVIYLCMLARRQEQYANENAIPLFRWYGHTPDRTCWFAIYTYQYWCPNCKQWQWFPRTGVGRLVKCRKNNQWYRLVDCGPFPIRLLDKHDVPIHHPTKELFFWMVTHDGWWEQDSIYRREPRGVLPDITQKTTPIGTARPHKRRKAPTPPDTTSKPIPRLKLIDLADLINGPIPPDLPRPKAYDMADLLERPTPKKKEG